MARGVNKVILIGNLGQDPDVRSTQGGTQVVNVSLATSDSWRDRNTGQTQDRTEWHRLVFFGKLAEIAAQYLRKGSQVYVEGRIQTNKWQGKDGQDRYTTEIVVNQMNMLGGRDSGGSSSSNAGGNWGNFDQTPSPAPQPAAAPQPQQAPQSQPIDNGGFDDDIPF